MPRIFRKIVQLHRNQRNCLVCVATTLDENVNILYVCPEDMHFEFQNVFVCVGGHNSTEINNIVRVCVCGHNTR